MFRFASAFGLWLMTGSPAPAEAPSVQRPAVQRPEPAAPAPAPTAPAPTAAPTPGAPPTLPPASGGAAPPTATPPVSPAADPAAPPVTAPLPPPAPAPPPVYEAAPAPVPAQSSSSTAPPMAGAPPTTAEIQWEKAPVAEPAPFTPPPRPFNTGIGLYILSGATLGTALGVRIAAITSDDGTTGLSGAILSIFYNPLFAAGFATYGGARAIHARRAAWDDLYGGARRRRRVVPGLGWGLLGGGVAVWLATRLVPLMAADSISTDRANLIWRAGYFASLPLTFTGIHLGAFGSSYNRQYRAYTMMENISLTPLRISLPVAGSGQAGEAWGLSLSGRF